MGNQNWSAVPDGRARLIWKCEECGTEYAVDPSEATIPYCSNDCCRNAGEETEFERVEVMGLPDPKRLAEIKTAMAMANMVFVNCQRTARSLTPLALMSDGTEATIHELMQRLQKYAEELP